jgi:hypothetical protein
MRNLHDIPGDGQALNSYRKIIRDYNVSAFLWNDLLPDMEVEVHLSNVMIPTFATVFGK